MYTRFLGCLVWVLCAGLAAAQIPISGPTTISQNFDSLANVGKDMPWSNNTTIPGFFAFQTNGATALTAYNPGQGGSGTGGAYSFGMAASTERAFGTIGSNAASAGGYAYGFILQNTGASALAISLAYEGEQWRVSGAAPQTRNFSFKTSSTNPNAYADWSPTAQLPVGYTALPALDFTSPNTGNPSGSVNGNLPANCTSFADTLVGTVQPNDYLVVRWYDPNQSGNDHGLGIDNVTLSAIVAVPEPASILAVCGIAGFAGNVVRRRWAPRKVAV